MPETKKDNRKKRPSRRPRPSNAVQITVWSASGSPLPQDTIRSLEEAVERVTLELFNDGQRLLTQTNVC
jgi:hypothetical protein